MQIAKSDAIFSRIIQRSAFRGLLFHDSGNRFRDDSNWKACPTGNDTIDAINQFSRRIVA